MVMKARNAIISKLSDIWLRIVGRPRKRNRIRRICPVTTVNRKDILKDNVSIKRESNMTRIKKEIRERELRQLRKRRKKMRRLKH